MSAETEGLHAFAQTVALLGGEFGVQHQLGHAENAVHGRANFMTHGREENALGFTGGFRGLLRCVQFLYRMATLRNIAEAPHAPGTFPIQELRLGVPLKDSTILELNHIIRRVIAISQELERADQESSGILELWSGKHQ